ncbi:uncharacterized protein LOC143450635 [Clavelina lepadiformis]|uniref:uncharacterized protein LOC143450635 n=1 Tax=Clavelina lepadiformis TaxID=159417 RepID=UPI0040419D1A
MGRKGVLIEESPVHSGLADAMVPCTYVRIKDNSRVPCFSKVGRGWMVPVAMLQQVHFPRQKLAKVERVIHRVTDGATRMTNLEIQVMKRWVKNFPEVRNFAPLTENEMACALESVEKNYEKILEMLFNTSKLSQRHSGRPKSNRTSQRKTRSPQLRGAGSFEKYLSPYFRKNLGLKDDTIGVKNDPTAVPLSPDKVGCTTGSTFDNLRHEYNSDTEDNMTASPLLDDATPQVACESISSPKSTSFGSSTNIRQDDDTIPTTNKNKPSDSTTIIPSSKNKGKVTKASSNVISSTDCVVTKTKKNKRNKTRSEKVCIKKDWVSTNSVELITTCQETTSEVTTETVSLATKPTSKSSPVEQISAANKGIKTRSSSNVITKKHSSTSVFDAKTTYSQTTVKKKSPTLKAPSNVGKCGAKQREKSRDHDVAIQSRLPNKSFDLPPKDMSNNQVANGYNLYADPGKQNALSTFTPNIAFYSAPPNGQVNHGGKDSRNIFDALTMAPFYSNYDAHTSLVQPYTLSWYWAPPVVQAPVVPMFPLNCDDTKPSKSQVTSNGQKESHVDVNSSIIVTSQIKNTKERKRRHRRCDDKRRSSSHEKKSGRHHKPDSRRTSRDPEPGSCHKTSSKLKNSSKAKKSDHRETTPVGKRFNDKKINKKYDFYPHYPRYRTQWSDTYNRRRSPRVPLRGSFYRVSPIRCSSNVPVESSREKPNSEESLDDHGPNKTQPREKKSSEQSSNMEFTARSSSLDVKNSKRVAQSVRSEFPLANEVSKLINLIHKNANRPNSLVTESKRPIARAGSPQVQRKKKRPNHPPDSITSQETTVPGPEVEQGDMSKEVEKMNSSPSAMIAKRATDIDGNGSTKDEAQAEWLLAAPSAFWMDDPFADFDVAVSSFASEEERKTKALDEKPNQVFNPNVQVESSVDARTRRERLQSCDLSGQCDAELESRNTYPRQWKKLMVEKAQQEKSKPNATEDHPSTDLTVLAPLGALSESTSLKKTSNAEEESDVESEDIQLRIFSVVSEKAVQETPVAEEPFSITNIPVLVPKLEPFVTRLMSEQGPPPVHSLKTFDIPALDLSSCNEKFDDSATNVSSPAVEIVSGIEVKDKSVQQADLSHSREDKTGLEQKQDPTIDEEAGEPLLAPSDESSCRSGGRAANPTCIVSAAHDGRLNRDNILKGNAELKQPVVEEINTSLKSQGLVPVLGDKESLHQDKTDHSNPTNLIDDKPTKAFIDIVNSAQTVATVTVKLVETKSRKVARGKETCREPVSAHHEQIQPTTSAEDDVTQSAKNMACLGSDSTKPTRAVTKKKPPTKRRTRRKKRNTLLRTKRRRRLPSISSDDETLANIARSLSARERETREANETDDDDDAALMSCEAFLSNVDRLTDKIGRKNENKPDDGIDISPASAASSVNQQTTSTPLSSPHKQLKTQSHPFGKELQSELLVTPQLSQFDEDLPELVVEYVGERCGQQSTSEPNEKFIQPFASAICSTSTLPKDTCSSSQEEVVNSSSSSTVTGSYREEISTDTASEDNSRSFSTSAGNCQVENTDTASENNSSSSSTDTGSYREEISTDTASENNSRSPSTGAGNYTMEITDTVTENIESVVETSDGTEQNKNSFCRVVEQFEKNSVSSIPAEIPSQPHPETNFLSLSNDDNVGKSTEQNSDCFLTSAEKTSPCHFSSDQNAGETPQEATPGSSTVHQATNYDDRCRSNLVPVAVSSCQLESKENFTTNPEKNLITPTTANNNETLDDSCHLTQEESKSREFTINPEQDASDRPVENIKNMQERANKDQPSLVQHQPIAKDASFVQSPKAPQHLPHNISQLLTIAKSSEHCAEPKQYPSPTLSQLSTSVSSVPPIAPPPGVVLSNSQDSHSRQQVKYDKTSGNIRAGQLRPQEFVFPTLEVHPDAKSSNLRLLDRVNGAPFIQTSGTVPLLVPGPVSSIRQKSLARLVQVRADPTQPLQYQHGIMEIEFRAPVSLLECTRPLPQNTSATPFLRRRVPYIQARWRTKLLGTKPHELPTDTDFLLIRLRDVALMLRARSCDVINSVSRHDIRLFRPGFYSERVFREIYYNNNGLFHSLDQTMAPEHEFLLRLQDYSEILLPEYYLKAFKIPKEIVAKYVSIVTYQPTDRINRDIIKMFSECCSHNLAMAKDDLKFVDINENTQRKEKGRSAPKRSKRGSQEKTLIAPKRKRSRDNSASSTPWKALSFTPAAPRNDVANFPESHAVQSQADHGTEYSSTVPVQLLHSDRYTPGPAPLFPAIPHALQSPPNPVPPCYRAFNVPTPVINPLNPCYHSLNRFLNAHAPSTSMAASLAHLTPHPSVHSDHFRQLSQRRQTLPDISGFLTTPSGSRGSHKGHVNQQQTNCEQGQINYGNPHSVGYFRENPRNEMITLGAMFVRDGKVTKPNVEKSQVESHLMEILRSISKQETSGSSQTSLASTLKADSTGNDVITTDYKCKMAVKTDGKSPKATSCVGHSTSKQVCKVAVPSMMNVVLSKDKMAASTVQVL